MSGIAVLKCLYVLSPLHFKRSLGSPPELQLKRGVLQCQADGGYLCFASKAHEGDSWDRSAPGKTF